MGHHGVLPCLETASPLTGVKIAGDARKEAEKEPERMIPEEELIFFALPRLQNGFHIAENIVSLVQQRYRNGPDVSAAGPVRPHHHHPETVSGAGSAVPPRTVLFRQRNGKLDGIPVCSPPRRTLRGCGEIIADPDPRTVGIVDMNQTPEFAFRINQVLIIKKRFFIRTDKQFKRIAEIERGFVRRIKTSAVCSDFRIPEFRSDIKILSRPADPPDAPDVLE